MLKALVVTPNEKTAEFGSLLAVARAEARRREKSERNPPVLALRFFPELGVYVAVYEAVDVSGHVSPLNSQAGAQLHKTGDDSHG
jgi:hypothetical protein